MRYTIKTIRKFTKIVRWIGIAVAILAALSGYTESHATEFFDPTVDSDNEEWSVITAPEETEKKEEEIDEVYKYNHSAEFYGEPEVEPLDLSYEDIMREMGLDPYGNIADESDETENAVSDEETRAYRRIHVYRGLDSRAMEENVSITIRFEDVNTKAWLDYSYEATDSPDIYFTLVEGTWRIKDVTLIGEYSSDYKITYDSESTFDIYDNEAPETTILIAESPKVKESDNYDKAQDDAQYNAYLEKEKEKTDKRYNIGLIIALSAVGLIVIAAVIIIIKKRRENQLH